MLQRESELGMPAACSYRLWDKESAFNCAIHVTLKALEGLETSFETEAKCRRLSYP